MLNGFELTLTHNEHKTFVPQSQIVRIEGNKTGATIFLTGSMQIDVVENYEELVDKWHGYTYEDDMIKVLDMSQ
tara:strand:+ start:451 stop:672 length:222 start_codon:yes stop_codon:yes gene_type:complete